MGIGGICALAVLGVVAFALFLAVCRVAQRAGIDVFAAQVGAWLTSPFVWAGRVLQAALDGLMMPVVAATRGLRDYCRDANAEWAILWELVVNGLAIAAGWLVVRADVDYTNFRLVAFFDATGGRFDGVALSGHLALAFVLTGATLAMLVFDLIGLTPTGRSVIFYALAGRAQRIVLIVLLVAVIAFVLDAALLALYGVESSIGVADATVLGITMVIFAVVLQVAVIGALISAAAASGAAVMVVGWFLLVALWLAAWVAYLPVLVIIGFLQVMASIVFFLGQFGVEAVRLLRGQPRQDVADVLTPMEVALPPPPTIRPSSRVEVGGDAPPTREPARAPDPGHAAGVAGDVAPAMATPGANGAARG